MTGDRPRLRLFCPALLTDGGIASYARMVVQALAPAPVGCFDLGAEAPSHRLPATAEVTHLASRGAFALSTMLETARGGEIVLAHVGLVRPLALMPVPKRATVTVLAHGREMWQRFSLGRSAGFRRVDRFVCTTIFTRDQFLEHNADRLRPGTAFDIIPLTAGRDAQGPVRLRPAGDRRRVVCISRLTGIEPLKGIAILVEAARLLPPSWEVRIVGDGPGRAEFEALAVRLGLAERVTFSGRVSEEDKRAEIDRADLLCLPSAQEGFGIVLLEALAAGRPCVGAAAGAIPEVLSPEVSELSPYGDPVLLAKAIERVGARLDRGELGPEALRRHYDEHFSFDLFAGRWRRLLGLTKP